MKIKFFILLILLTLGSICKASVYKPLGGYINYRSDNLNQLYVGLESHIFFEDANFPDSVRFNFGDGKSSFVLRIETELTCNGIWKCVYKSNHMYPGPGTYLVNVEIDTQTFLAGKNLKKPIPYFLEALIIITPGQIPHNTSTNLANIGLVNFYEGLRFSIPIQTEYLDSFQYSILSNISTIPENSISIHPETGDILIKQLPDTGLYLFTVMVEGSNKNGHKFHTHFVHLNIRNDNIQNPLKIKTSLEEDGKGFLISKIKAGDSLKQKMDFYAPSIDSVSVEIISKISFAQKPMSQITRVNDTFSIESIFIMDQESYQSLPQSVLFKMNAYQSGQCQTYYSSFYFAPENYIPIGIGSAKIKNNITILPNPTKGLFTLNRIIKENAKTEVHIFDMTGHEMPFGQNGNEIDITDLLPGIYFVCVKHEDNFYSQKIIKY